MLTRRWLIGNTRMLVAKIERFLSFLRCDPPVRTAGKLRRYECLLPPEGRDSLKMLRALELALKMQTPNQAFEVFKLLA
jgi:hypothetical protein